MMNVPGYNVEMLEEFGRMRRQVLHRVPALLREKKKDIYEPLVVSLGPYHHTQPNLNRLEHFKDEVLSFILGSSGNGDKNKGPQFCSQILERVDEIRSFYGGLSMDEYDDETLVEMMARDACLLLYYMLFVTGDSNTIRHATLSIGPLGIQLMRNDDYFKLDNQIPWWIFKMLTSLKFPNDLGEGLICSFLSLVVFSNYYKVGRVPWGKGRDEEEPPHLIEACRLTYFKQHTCRWWKSSSFPLLKSMILCASKLKEKGIYFRASSELLDDIKFTSHSFYGVLYLPKLFINSATATLLSNTIVLELSPGSAKYPVTSFVNFMKSLIESPRDVKVLQENGILVTSNLVDNERIVKMFNKFDTMGLEGFEVREIKTRINKHCSSRAKTWINELIFSKFHTPWSATALFAAAFFLYLMYLKTYYTISPRNSGS